MATLMQAQQYQQARVQQIFAQREAHALRARKSDAARFAAAGEAREAGDVRLAGMIYARVALSRFAMQQHKRGAQAALKELRAEGRADLSDIEARLGLQDLRSPLLSPLVRRTAGSYNVAAGDEEIADLMLEFKQLRRDYSSVPGVGKEIEKRYAQLERIPRIAGTLKEPYAVAFWERGQAHEESDELCCAILNYRVAAEQLPAPSARLAQSRLTHLEADAKLVASAERCQHVRECHELFDRANRLARSDDRRARRRARELFAQVVDEAPRDSTVFTAAQNELAVR